MLSLKQQFEESKKLLSSSIEESYKNACNELKGIKFGTLWYRWVRDSKGYGFWEFNHLEDGHCQNQFPTPKHESQKSAWKGGKWAKAHVQLRKGVVEHYLIY